MGKGSVDQDPADRCGDNSDKDQARLIVHHCALNKRDPNQSRGLPVSAGYLAPETLILRGQNGCEDWVGPTVQHSCNLNAPISGFTTGHEDSQARSRATSL